jgi:MORN repeat variant
MKKHQWFLALFLPAMAILFLLAAFVALQVSDDSPWKSETNSLPVNETAPKYHSTGTAPHSKEPDPRGRTEGKGSGPSIPETVKSAKTQTVRTPNPDGTQDVREVSSNDVIIQRWQEALVAGVWVKHGEYEARYENGSLALTGRYDHGAHVGRWTMWAENGRMVHQSEYKDDLLSGQWQTWHENGQLAQSGRYDQGLRVGDWTTYEMNGRIESSGPYINGKRNGVWMNYDYDAAEVTETVYKDDEAVSISRRTLK